MDVGNDVREKANNMEADQRREVIFEMMLKGYRKSQIVRFCSENYKIGERQVEKYITQVNDDFAERSEKRKEVLIGQAIARYNDLYQKSYQIQDYRECRAVQESINKMFGINEPDKIDMTSGGQPINVISLGNGKPETST
jgi:hypothetical protein